MKVVINGEEREMPEGLTIRALLSLLELEQKPVAVEVNERVVRRAQHPEFKLKTGDKVEIVTFVGGG